MIAIDEDEEDNGSITYSIEDTRWSNLFRINPNTGVISAKPGLDPKEDYEFKVPVALFIILSLCCGVCGLLCNV